VPRAAAGDATSLPREVILAVLTTAPAHLVGRTAHIAALDDALDELAGRRPCVVELSGEPGMGKTRLLAELAARAERRGLLVLSGSASELAGGQPFGVFVDALDEYLEGLDPRRLAGLDDDVRGQLADVFPGLSGAVPAARSDHRYRTHRAVSRLLEHLAPLVLVLDDVHWADAGTIELLGALLRRPPAQPVLLALAFRPRQLPDRLIGALERGGLRRVEVGALSAEEARELVGSEFDDALYEESAGNPFYLEQLARAPRRGVRGEVAIGDVSVPRGVAVALSDELTLLSRRARGLLEGAAVVGDPFEPELAAAAAELGEEEAIAVLDELLARDMVRTTDVPRRFRFRHPLVRGAVYEAAPGGWRLRAHERVADALRSRGAPAVERAPHVERSARRGDLAAVAVLREAGAAVAPRSPAGAAQLYAAGARLLSPCAARTELLMALAGAHLAAGQFHEAYDATRECLAEVDDEDARRRLTALWAALENTLGQFEGAFRRLSAGLATIDDRGSPEALAFLIELTTNRIYSADYAAACAWAEQAVTVARGLGSAAVRVPAEVMLAFARVCAGDIDAARTACSDAAALVDGLADAELGPLVVAVARLGGTEIYLDDHAAAGRHTDRALKIAAATGQADHSTLLFWIGSVRREQGRLSEAAEILDRATEVCRTNDHTLGLGWNLANRALVAVAAGDNDAALAIASESIALLRPLPRSWGSALAGVALAAARLDAGDPQGALEDLDAWAGPDLELIQAGRRAACWELRARCLLALGRSEDAAAAATAATLLADAHGLRWTRALADRTAALVALEPADAVSLALAAAAGAEAVGAGLEAAQARVVAGLALARAGEGERAAAELGAAAAVFDAHGATRRRDAAERELRRLGYRKAYRRSAAGRQDGGAVGSLTGRELQIARLIVDRRTNAEIAAELFLSTKTIETHIRNIFHKLDVASRKEVARIVERSDVD
jgi:DNA-binding CsgD family transcriptional regulator